MTNDTRQKGGPTGPLRDGILRELCERKATLLLATPYLSFESRILERDGDRLRLRASMGREVALNTLSRQPLRLRFPWDLTIFSGSTRILDYEQEGQRRSLVVAVPESLGVDEQRRAYRVDRVGKSRGSLGSTAGGEVSIQPFSLENLSPLGAGLFLKECRNLDSWAPGNLVQVSLELEGGPSFSTTARVRHSKGPYLGLEFLPPLDEAVLQGLTPWLKTRRAEAQRRWDSRAELREQAREAAKPKLAPSGLLLLSSDPLLGPQIEVAMGGHELRVVPAVMAPYKSALGLPPLLLLLDTLGMGSEERRRAKALLEAQAPGCPILILGRDPENEQARGLTLELKRASYLEWSPARVAPLRILIQGLIRKHGKTE